MTLKKIRCARCVGTGTIRRKDPSGHGDIDTICCPDCNHDPHGTGYGTPETVGWITVPEGQEIMKQETIDLVDVPTEQLCEELRRRKENEEIAAWNRKENRKIAVECDTCEGEGKVKVPAVSSLEDVIGHTIITCHQCKGKGTLFALLPKKKGNGTEKGGG
jgi:hypothetical protein